MTHRYTTHKNNIYKQGHTIYTDKKYPIYIYNTYLYNNNTENEL